jgi:hypothetical protein
MPVRLSQDAVSGLGQKHGATDNTVCAEEHVDDEKSIYLIACGMSPSAAKANAQKKADQRE